MPLLIMVAGTVLLGLLLVRVGLEVATALLYVLGGLVLGLSVTGFGRRLLSAWLIAAVAVVLLPLLWSVVFATGAALMLDAGATGGHGGFASFVAQLVQRRRGAGGVLDRDQAGARRLSPRQRRDAPRSPRRPAVAGAGATGRAAAGARLQALAQNATPAGLARFSQGLRGTLAAGARYPLRHPTRAAQAASYPLRRPVQATREAASGLRAALSATGATAGRAGQSAAGWYRDGARRWSLLDACRRRARRQRRAFGQRSWATASERVTLTGELRPSRDAARRAAHLDRRAAVNGLTEARSQRRDAAGQGAPRRSARRGRRSRRPHWTLAAQRRRAAVSRASGARGRSGGRVSGAASATTATARGPGERSGVRVAAGVSDAE